MTNKDFETLIELLNKFSFEWHADRPPVEITKTIEMAEISLQEQKNYQNEKNK